jgi:phosphoribosylamine--glycine ligase
MSRAPTCILVIGNGARENALANAILTSPDVAALYIAPPNWGIVDSATPCGVTRVHTLDIGVLDTDALVAAAVEHRIELAVVGPEAPLVAGLSDALRNAGIPTVGPGADAARLEGSKDFAKGFMRAAGIPTADYQTFSELTPLLAYIEAADGPLVLKADGLAAGKGVIVCDDRQQAVEAARRIMDAREFGESGATVVVEERLSGPEISFTVLIAGGRAEVLPPSSDYKRLKDGDQGPNTGGMGNICPTPHATDEVVVEFARDILGPFMEGLRQFDLDYRGFLFVGTMLTEQGLKVIEFNVRFGDPEAAAVLPLCDADWPALLGAMAAGELPQLPDGSSTIRVRDAACVAVVLASGGYPVSKAAPAVIEGLDRVANRGLLLGAGGLGDVQLLFAGVDREGGSAETYASFMADDDATYLANGGRILTISARAETLSLARRLAYEVAGNLRFDGMQFRSDIGKSDS